MLLKRLTEASGLPGNEKEIRDIIKDEIKDYVDEIKVDRLGNLIALKKGKEGYPKVMLAAHMDEIGLMVKSIDEGGFIKFVPVGGIDDRILVSKIVQIGSNKVPGVIGAKAIHLQEPDERTKALKHKQLYIDIGAKSKAEAEKLVSKGDYISFLSDYIEFGNNLVKAKALDDRVGCAILIELLKETYDATLYAVFTVQEEIGLRGARVAAYGIDPDFALVVEGTVCSDVTNVDEAQHGTRLGHGPAISIMDMASLFDKGLIKQIHQTAVDNNINIQFRQITTGGNDAGAIHVTREGIPSAALSIPCRYIHSPSSIMSKDDFDGCGRLLKLFLKNIKKEAYARG